MNPPIYQDGNCIHCGSRWHLAEYCPFKTIPPDEIQITKYGETLIAYPKSDMEDSRILAHCFAVHYVCNGFLDLHPITSEHNAITCRVCNLRIVIPNTIETFGELRKYFARKIITDER
jgi:hypothetical protein